MSVLRNVGIAAPGQTTGPGRATGSNDLIAYVAITLFVALSYILTLGHYIDFVNHILPAGDPFSYTVNWFLVIDHYRANGYLPTLKGMLAQPMGWYRLMSVSEAALAPILTKEPYVICIINYLLFGIATATFYRLGRRLGLTVAASFCVALIPWLWPVNYGFEDQTSLPVLALDAAFEAALFWAVAQAYIFAFDLRGAKSGSALANLRRGISAIATGLVIGIAISGRGNSLPVVGLVVLWPGLMALWLAWRSRDILIWIAVGLVAIVAGAITVQFYAQFWNPLRDYYSVHTSLVEGHHWNYSDARQFILNVPGFMYWRAEDSAVCISLTFASHFFAMSMLAVAWWPRGPFSGSSHFAFRQLVTGGAIIYFGTYLVDMVLFANNESGLSIYQALLVWRPMLIGLSLMLIALLTEFLPRLSMRLVHFMPAPLSVLLLGWGMMWTFVYTPWDLARILPSPRTVERLAVNLDQLAGNGPIAVLWYAGWNEPILNYYRLENDLPVVHQFPYPDIDAVWSMSDYSAQKRARVLAQMKNIFNKASLIVIPEFTDEYGSDEYYAFYRFKEDWVAWLNSDQAPRFRVVMLLQESPSVRLLVIRRLDVAKGQGDPFRLPYGDRPGSPQPDYSDAVVRFH
jgi:hypothetical protein